MYEGINLEAFSKQQFCIYTYLLSVPELQETIDTSLMSVYKKNYRSGSESIKTRGTLEEGKQIFSLKTSNCLFIIISNAFFKLFYPFLQKYI